MWLVSTRNGHYYTTSIEEWTRDQDFTEVFDFSHRPYSKEEMAITGIFDRLLGEVLFSRKGIDAMAAQANGRKLTARRPRKGEQQVNTWQGTSIDGLFKDRVLHSMDAGELKPYKHLLTIVGQGAAGPDVYARSLVVAWDVTTAGSAWQHIRRDVIRRAWDRYYLLIWDEPRTKPQWVIQALNRQG